jgi:phosphate transport system permease protein
LQRASDIVAVARPRHEAGPPRRRDNLPDRAWSASLGVLGAAVLVVALLIVAELWRLARPYLATTGLARFVTTSQWDVVRETYGALPFVYGTLVTSGIALVLALPISVGLALFLTEMSPPRLRAIVSFPISLLAGIPSVVFGLWGLFVLVPILRGSVEPFLAHALGFLPLFQGPQIGLGYLAAGTILAIMILPTITSIAIEVLRTVPLSLREAALALGATRWETIRIAVLPYGRAGIVGASILGLGRALGETMAVTMVIGNRPEVSVSLFAPGYTMASVLANEFTEATSDLYVSALVEIGLLLLVVTVLVNGLARLLVWSVGGPARGARG